MVGKDPGRHRKAQKQRGRWRTWCSAAAALLALALALTWSTPRELWPRGSAHNEEHDPPNGISSHILDASSSDRCERSLDEAARAEYFVSCTEVLAVSSAAYAANRPNFARCTRFLRKLQQSYDASGNLVLERALSFLLGVDLACSARAFRQRARGQFWLHDRFRRASRFVHHVTGLRRTAPCSAGNKTRRTERVASQGIPPISNVVVVGGGPAGLLSAITLARSDRCLPVYVVEKRSEYSRNQWIDLYDEPLFPSLSELIALGMEYQEVELVAQPANRDAVTMRVKTLEAFLSRVAAVLGAALRYRARLLGASASAGAVLAPPWRPVPYRVLVGADGVRSGVRSSAKTSFPLFRHPLLPETAQPRQATIIAHFRPMPSGTCPEVALADVSLADLVWVGARQKPTGVLQIFKRFYRGFCEMQIMLARTAGERALQSREYARELLYGAQQSVLLSPALSMAELRESVTDWNVVVLDARVAEKIAWPDSQNDAVSVVLAGDSLVTAHYRLGIGINGAFLRAKLSRQALYALAIAADAADAAMARADYERIVRNAAVAAAKLIAESVYAEVDCGLRIAVDPQSPLGAPVSVLDHGNSLLCRGAACIVSQCKLKRTNPNS